VTLLSERLKLHAAMLMPKNVPVDDAYRAVVASWASTDEALTRARAALESLNPTSGDRT
jgi:hypothetical protein